MQENVLKFLNSSSTDVADYPLKEMENILTSGQDGFMSEIATQFESAAEKAMSKNLKNFPYKDAAQALVALSSNVIGYHEESDSEKRTQIVMNVLDFARQIWNIARIFNESK